MGRFRGAGGDLGELLLHGEHLRGVENGETHTENRCLGLLGGILETSCASNGILLQGWIILRLRLAFRLLTPCFQLASCPRSAFFQQVLFFV